MSLEFIVKKDFGGFMLDMELHADNEVLALLGASGCGKSMTLRCISGIITPDEGRIVVNGEVLFDSEKNINLPPQQRRVGLLFQNYALFPNMTVEQNIMTGMNQLDLTKEQKKANTEEVIRKFYLDGLEKHKPAQLSGGQQQRVALARIMVSKPRILMLDEPFSALDSYLRRELEQELMKVIAEYEGTTIIVSHNRDEVYRISDHIAVISDGKKDCYDQKEKLFANPPTYQAALLTGCRNFTRAEYVDDQHVKAVDWGTVFEYNAPADVHYIAARPKFLELAPSEGKNTAKFKVKKAIDNLSEMILILDAAEGTDTDYSGINVNVSKEMWEPYDGASEVFVRFNPEDVLMLAR